jgi:formamidopyrimidine-DNA glycosylase
MPELPEVEAVCRRIRGAITGKRIERVIVVRPSVVRPQSPARFVSAVEGDSIRAVSRRGKNVLVELSSGSVIRIHLRMTGDLRVLPDSVLRPLTARLLLVFVDGTALILDDMRALGKVHLLRNEATVRQFALLGPEPLSPLFTVEAFAGIARRSRQPAKLFLMDQRRVAGLGNIYAAEALFRARIHPQAPMNRLTGPKLEKLHSAIVSVLIEAVESAERAYSQPGQIAEGEWFPVAVYGREGEPCPSCERMIRRIRQGGRSTYYCPGCQRK